MNQKYKELIHSDIVIKARQLPNKIAIKSEESQVTFYEFLSKIIYLAERLDSLELKKINLLKSNSIEFLLFFFSSSMIGGQITLFDPSWPVNLVKKLLTKSNSNIIILDNKESLKKEYSNYKTYTYQDFNLGKVGKKNNDNSSEYFYISINSSSTFLNGFTSGSLSDPKMFSRSHKSWVKSLSMSRKEFLFSDKDKAIIPGPLSHGISLFGALDILSNGGTLNILKENKNNKKILDIIVKENITVIILVPTKLDILCDVAQKNKMNSVLKIVSAGSKLSDHTRQKALITFPNAEIIEYYGASELSFVSVAKSKENCPTNSVGRPFSGVTIDIRDANGKSLKQGQVGEIWVKSDMICDDYSSSSEGGKFKVDGSWATVGDIGRLDQNNFLFLSKRTDSIITSAGHTIDLASIEDKLKEFPGIKEAIVTSITHKRWGEIIVAMIVPYINNLINEFILNEYCKLYIEVYSHPKLWHFTDKIPLTSSGKINYSSIKKKFQNKKF